MNIHIGDKVRFLNEEGGGKVCRITDNIVHVLDEDGFEIPTPIREVVVIESATKNKPGLQTIDTTPEYEEVEYTEKKDDSDSNFMLATVLDEQNSSLTNLYLVNDSNYFAFYNIVKINPTTNTLSPYFNGILEPNTKIELEKVDINYLASKKLKIQLILYKRSSDYKPMDMVDTELSFSAPTLVNAKQYSKVKFFANKAILFNLLDNEYETKLNQLRELSTGQINTSEIIKEKNDIEVKTKTPRSNTKELLEIDLHMHELLDDYSQLSKKEMLEYQLKTFHEVMRNNEKNKGKKIVFIHGKGNGTLKSEVLKALKKQYKWHTYQDASFQNYGFGATMVII